MFRLLFFSFLLSSLGLATDPPVLTNPPVEMAPPKSDAEYNAVLNEALGQLKATNNKAEKNYGIGTFARWDIDQREGVLKFSDSSGVVKVTSPVVVVGSYSSVSKTFMWSWANSSILPALTKDILPVKAYGEKNRLVDFTNAKIDGEEQDAWAMSAMAFKIIGGEAVYRAPTKTGSLFMILKKISRQD